MIHVHVEVVRNIRTAVEETNNSYDYKIYRVYTAICIDSFYDL